MWRSLTEELDRWLETGKTATLWWRDDDAVGLTPQLELLLRCAQPVPLALAVIPRFVEPDLALRLRQVSSVAVLQHGWAHSNHATGTKSEYPATRSQADVEREFADGRQVLDEHFGTQSIPVFAPPWHGLDERFLPLLAQNGIKCVSRIGPRRSRLAAAGLPQVNAHVAPIKWTIPPSFGGDAEYVSAIIDHLRGRRTERFDRDEPTGLLTHHLAQNPTSYEFMSRLLDVTLAHPAAKWIDLREILTE